MQRDKNELIIISKIEVELQLNRTTCTLIVSAMYISLLVAGDLTTLKNKAITIKEGVSYRIKITFKVNSLCSVLGT